MDNPFPGQRLTESVEKMFTIQKRLFTTLPGISKDSGIKLYF
jgi:hypothetical protein